MFCPFAGLLGDEKGHASTLITLFLLPVVLLGGMGLDLSYGWALKSQLFTYAEMAAAKSIGPRSKGLLHAVSMTGDGMVPEGAEQARALFLESLPDAYVDRGVNVKTVVERQETSLVAEVTFKTVMPTHFLRFFGIPSLTISGTSSSEKQLDPYHDFYLFLDNSPSMGVAASGYDRVLLAKNTRDGCVFACHVTDGSDSTFHVARRVGVQLRIDLLADAARRMVRTLMRKEQFPGQFRLASYVFGQDSADNPPLAIGPLTSDTATAMRDLRRVRLMTTRRPGYRGDMLSDFDAALAGLAKAIGPAGDGGMVDNPRKTLLMVTDGLSNSRKPAGCSQALRYTRCQSPIDPEACDALKSAGVSIAILYTAYPSLPGNRWYDEWISPFAGTIGPALKRCASPGLYAETDDDSTIADMLTTLLESHINLDRVIASTN